MSSADQDPDGWLPSEVVAATRAFVEAARVGDPPAFTAALQTLMVWGDLRPAFEGVIALGSVAEPIRERFICAFLMQGEKLRIDRCDDVVVLDALRVFLPPYEGPAVTLYRGEDARNVPDAKWGWCWSSSRGVAEWFADRYAAGVYDAVLLRARVPADAIISAPGLLDTVRDGEDEYIVDRRLLGAVEVVERVPARNFED